MNEHPTARFAKSIRALAGHVFTASDGKNYRWDGTEWHALKAGDWCLDANGGAAIFWTGSRWERPRVTDGQAVDLAHVLDPGAFEPANDVPEARRQELITMARNALGFGYIHRFNPAHDPAVDR